MLLMTTIRHDPFTLASGPGKTKVLGEGLVTSGERNLGIVLSAWCMDPKGSQDSHAVRTARNLNPKSRGERSSEVPRLSRSMAPGSQREPGPHT